MTSRKDGASWGSITSRSRSATSTRRSRSTASCSSSRCAAARTGWRSSTWATSSSRSLGGRTQPPDEHRHFGLVVDDKEATRRALEAAGVEILPGRGLDFRDPWGNLVQIVQYDEVQFTKTPAVLRSLALELGKTERARDELRAKGIDPDG